MPKSSRFGIFFSKKSSCEKTKPYFLNETEGDSDYVLGWLPDSQWIPPIWVQAGFTETVTMKYDSTSLILYIDWRKTPGLSWIKGLFYPRKLKFENEKFKPSWYYWNWITLPAIFVHLKILDSACILPFFRCPTHICIAWVILKFCL